VLEVRCLALSLIESLEPSDEAAVEIDESWRREVERRAAQLDRGEAQPIPGDEVFARLRQKLG
jgi:putative addiction module component (TIGR02574 family)